MYAWNLIRDNIYVVDVFLILLLGFLFTRRRQLNLPPGPFNLPIVGYLPFLGQEPHVKLKELAEKYGNIFSLRLGLSPVVVLADFEAVREAFGKASTTDRPPDMFHFMPDQLGLASINGSDWIEQRRYTVKLMKDLGLGKSKWETQVEEEVRSFVRFLEDQQGRPLDVKTPLITTVSSNVLSLLFGRPLPPNDPKREVFTRGIRSFGKVFTQTGFQCLMPRVIEALAKIGVKVRDSRFQEDLVVFNGFVRGEMKRIKENMGDENKEGYVHRYLTDMQEMSTTENSSYNEQSLAGNVQSYILGGTETTMITLYWLFLAMATHPQVQDAVHRELDSVLGDQRDPQWSQHSSLPYTYAAILEVMRWRTLLPLNMLHLTAEDIQLGGYDVPKGTVLIGLLHALHNDTRYWKDPEEYRPERFLDPNGKVVTRKESWAPFSLGKRNCPGEIVAMIELFLYFASVMQKFTVRSVDPNPDLKGRLGIVMQPNDLNRLRFEARSSKKTGTKG